MVFNLIVIGKIIDLTLFVVFTCFIVCMVLFLGSISSFISFSGLFIDSSISLGFEQLPSSYEIFVLIIICKSFHIL